MGGWVSGWVGLLERRVPRADSVGCSGRRRGMLAELRQETLWGKRCESRACKARGRIVVLGEDGDDECWVWRRSLPVQYVATL